MAWVVDTSVLLDVRIGVPRDIGERAADVLQSHVGQGLIVCPVTFIELAPAFGGQLAAERDWLTRLRVSCSVPWLDADTNKAHALWHHFTERKRQKLASKRPIADVLIAAFASRFDGLITRNASDFRSIDPDLPLVLP